MTKIIPESSWELYESWFNDTIHSLTSELITSECEGDALGVIDLKKSIGLLEAHHDIIRRCIRTKPKGVGDAKKR